MELFTMHENEISEKIIGAAIEVHCILGPGLLESVYEDALCHELHLRGLHFKRQQSVPIPYKEIKLGTDLRLDLLVEDKVIVDLKAKEKLSTIDKPKLLTYLRLSLCREVKERSSLTCCNKDDTPMEALTIAKYRQHHTGGVAKPLYAAKAVKLLW